MFAVKAWRFTTHKKDLAAAGELVEAFLVSGITELGPKLGPVLWQFPPARAFEREIFAAFLGHLPAKQDGLPLRHVIETRHGSFNDPTYAALLGQWSESDGKNLPTLTTTLMWLVASPDCSGTKCQVRTTSMR